jgi:DNA polymerase III delta prime subunit
MKNYPPKKFARNEQLAIFVKINKSYRIIYMETEEKKEIAQEKTSKLDIWERKLLDFSMRNSLLSLSLRRRALQLTDMDVATIEDKLADGEEYPIMSDAETKSILKNIYRTARNAIEETGANSLFVAIGTLRWYEKDSSDTERCAPILLLPVDMVYKRGGYYVRMRDEETMLNITLKEYISQMFQIELEGLNPLPKDEHGVDVPLVLKTVREAIEGQKRWKVVDEAILGTFSFSKFLMWNDVHNHREELKRNKVVNSLVEQHLTWTPEPVETDLHNVDCCVAPSEVALPVSADSSQMSAVIESGKGRSFILYGPPGTGKSQTITNLIANALYHEKRVLFVAEKMAALSVVESRLNKIGLGPFCLEMHSNKVAKKHVLEQLESALNVTHIVSSAEFGSDSEKIFERRKSLIGYLEGLHTVDPSDGLSLYDCIVRYEKIDAESMEEFERNSRLDSFIHDRGFVELSNLIERMDTMIRLVGQPSENPLCGLRLPEEYTREATIATLRRVDREIDDALANYDDLSRIATLRSSLLKDNSEALLAQDGRQLYDEWRAAKAKWFLPGFFAKRNVVNKMRAYNKYIVEGEMDATLGDLVEYGRLHEVVGHLQATLAEQLGAKLKTDTMPSRETLADSSATVKRWMANADKMDDWDHWNSYCRELEAAGLDCVVREIEKQPWNIAELRDAYLKAMYRNRAEERIAHNPQFAKFEGMIFDDVVKAYRKLTNEFHLLTQKELYARLAANVPRVSDGIDSSSEIGFLKRNISNNGRGMALRDIFDKIPNLLPKLCPCMLMSPMSVAKYLDLRHEAFDLVIFDEASQMPTSEAVGAIARGKALIVVGDPKQMPPTSFFSSSSVDEEEAYIDDMESILEDCKSLDLPSLQLNWHYRSRHESLIAFSNNEYYDGKLITFPSVDDQQAKVKLIHVDGCYDKGGKRNNPAEAEAIVNEIVRRLRDEKLRGQSIGVISFSVVQQFLIEDMLQDKLDSDSSLREAADQMYEPIFVKNLENVQGDERDVILFSIGYGPTQDGTVSMNFGPLNNVGGERRLNVAVSRARMEMYVFSTLKASQIDMRRTKARGVEGLKHFLEFAEFQNTENSKVVVGDDSDVTISNQIAAELRKQGLCANVAVGRSAFKVDVAISDPATPDIYFFGILLDGKGYVNTKTTRDREIVQPSVLGGLRWKIMRVWSIDWFRNPQRVIERIMKEVEAVRNNTAEPEPKAPAKFDISEEKIEEVPTNAIPYEEYELKGEHPDVDSALICRSVVRVEQPISMTLLCRRVARLRSMPKVTQALQKEVSEFAERELYVENDRDVRMVWATRDASLGYKNYRPNTSERQRDVADISMVELKNATLESVCEQLSIPEENLRLSAAKKMGFARRSASVDNAFRLAIDALVQSGEVQLDGQNVKKFARNK